MREHPCLPSLGEHCGECHRCTSPERPYVLTLDPYEASNLLYALRSHKCLDSGDWYVQVRDRLLNLIDETAPTPNAIWCVDHGHAHVDRGSSCRYCGHDASTHVGPYCGQPPVIEKDSYRDDHA